MLSVMGRMSIDLVLSMTRAERLSLIIAYGEMYGGKWSWPKWRKVREGTSNTIRSPWIVEPQVM